MNARYILSLLIILFLLPEPVKAQFVRKNVKHDGETRTYLIHLPAGYAGETDLPLVINMHGFGSNATEQAVYSRFNALADFNNFIAVYPEGLVATIPLGTGQHWDAYFNTGVDDVGFIDKMIDLMWNEYSIDLSRVYATGMSNGGYMSFTLACELSDRIAAVGSVTGSMVLNSFGLCDPVRAVPVIQFHGTEDQVVAYEGSGFGYSIPDVMEFWADQNVCIGDPVITELDDIDEEDGSTVTRMRYTDCKDEVSVDFYRIDGGGHTWPGALIDQPALGNTNKDINASNLIWEFFSNYTHPNPREPEIITSVDEIVPSRISVYPTFVQDNFTVTLPYNAQLQAYSIDGRVRLTAELQQGANIIPAYTWPGGMYILSILPESGTPEQFRIIK